MNEKYLNIVRNQLIEYRKIEEDRRQSGYENYSHNYIYFGYIEGELEVICCNERCIPEYFKVVLTPNEYMPYCCEYLVPSIKTLENIWKSLIIKKYFQEYQEKKLKE